MELPPSRSSSTSDCKSLCLPPLDASDSPPTPDSMDAGSEASWRPASSSPCSLTEAPGVTLGLGLSPGVVVGGTSWRDRAETEASLRRLLPTLDALLQQLDRVTMATEDLYHLECRLEQTRRKRRSRRRERGGAGWGEDQERRSGKEKHKESKRGKRMNKSVPLKDCGTSRKTPVPRLKASPASTQTPPPVTPRDWDPPSEREPLPSSSLFNHPAHTTTIPTRKRKRKPPPLKNKVHPNLDRHGPAHHKS